MPYRIQILLNRPAGELFKEELDKGLTDDALVMQFLSVYCDKFFTMPCPPKFDIRLGNKTVNIDILGLFFERIFFLNKENQPLLVYEHI